MSDTHIPVVESPRTEQDAQSKKARKKIFVFSPDRDLAQSLSMLFENHFEISVETSMGSLSGQIAAVGPDLVIVDLHTFSSDVMLELNIVESCCSKMPVVILRAYNRLRSDVEEMVQRAAKVVFYKPFNAEEVVRSIHALLSVEQ
jgi:DNA-binding NtrC family response regulator